MKAESGNPKSLQDAIERSGKSRIRIADECRVTDAAVGHWVTGRFQPNGPSRIALGLALGVPLAVVDSWFAAPEPQAVAS